MSWVFGIIGSSVNGETAARCRSIHSAALGTFHQAGQFYFAAGGLPETCLLNTTVEDGAETARGITLGCAFHPADSAFTHVSLEGWNAIGENDDVIDRLEGHFIRISFSPNRVRIWNDRLGLRTLYWMETPSHVVVSSRMDWISAYANALNIDFSKLGSRWLIFNQLTYDCPVEGVKRMGPAGRLTIGGGAVSYSDSPFTPAAKRAYQPEPIVERLRRYVNPVMGNGLGISLGLSGGLDSRVLLSFLLNARETEFTTHTFGNAADPDVAIPQRISRTLGFSHAIHDAPVPDVPQLIALFTDYVAQTNLIEPVSTVLRLRHYHGLDHRTHFLMDGGFGEIARRQYLNRLALKGARVIEKRSVGEIHDSLRAQRADIFCAEVHREMAAGVDLEIAAMLESMPALSTMDLENYLDLWAVRTRIPNFSSDEQARMDSTIVNFMPFAQPGFIDDVFTIPLKYRRNGRLFRSLISRLHAPLKRYPLVKNNTTYPYFLPTYGAWAWAKAKSALGYRYHDNSTHEFLDAIKEYALDVLHSRETTEYAPYKISQIRANVIGYYRGNRALSNEVNWWLSFDLWRRNFK